MKALVLFSGGLDSTTCLALAVKEYGANNVIALSLYYGQKHKKEIEAANRISEYYNVQHICYNVAEIFERGGEGAVCYKKGVLYTPGKRSSAWTTIKVKQEITSEIDAIITDVVQGEKLYHGDDIGHWPLWENARTGELVQGEYFGEYQTGGAYTPVTKNYWNKWPAAIQVGVYNKEGIIIPLCKVSGLTEEFKTALRDNPNEWIGTPVTLTGMMVSERRANSEGEGISIRHPILRSLRKDDLDPKDCTLEKILG